MLNWIKYTLLFVLLVVLQVGLFNNIHILGYATPILYIYFILKLPIDMNRNLVLLLAFLMGFSIDVFGYTLGLNMTVCTLTGFLRHYAIKVFTPRDLFESAIPSYISFGKGLYRRYTISLTLFHLTILFLLENLSFFDFTHLLYRIGGSFILSIFLILFLERLNWGFIKK